MQRVIWQLIRRYSNETLRHHTIYLALPHSPGHKHEHMVAAEKVKDSSVKQMSTRTWHVGAFTVTSLSLSLFPRQTHTRLRPVRNISDKFSLLYNASTIFIVARFTYKRQRFSLCDPRQSSPVDSATGVHPAVFLAMLHHMRPGTRSVNIRRRCQGETLKVSRQ